MIFCYLLCPTRIGLNDLKTLQRTQSRNVERSRETYCSRRKGSLDYSVVLLVICISRGVIINGKLGLAIDVKGPHVFK